MSAIFPSSPGWNWSPPTVDPEPRSVDRLPDARRERQEEEHDREDAEDVLVALEHAVVVPQPEERRCEGADADHDPDSLPQRARRAEAVDLCQPDRGEQRGHRQEVRIGERHGEPRDDVGDEVEGEEERGVAERAGRDVRLERDVDAREADRGEDSDGEEGDELAVPETQRESPQMSSAATIASRTSTARTTRTRRCEIAGGGPRHWRRRRRTPASRSSGSPSASATAGIVTVSSAAGSRRRRSPRCGRRRR